MQNEMIDNVRCFCNPTFGTASWFVLDYGYGANQEIMVARFEQGRLTVYSYLFCVPQTDTAIARAIAMARSYAAQHGC